MSVWGMIRLGASVQENALATLTDLLGDPTAVDHKPARADIQKYKNAYDLFNGTYDKDAGTTGPPKDPEAAKEWQDKYGLNETEKRIVAEYQMSYQVLDEDPQRAFTQTIKKLRADNDLGLHGLNDQELKRFVGGALKKYEQQNYPMLYQAISNALNDAYRLGPHESYKMWPRMVQWIKDRFEFFLWTENATFNPKNQSWHKLDVVPHLVDIATEGGAILSQLRAENKLPQNFDVNQLSAGEFEQWLMDWKKENRESEAAGQVVYEFHNGWTIQRLMTPESLQFEGDEMGHCVGSYSNDVSRGSSVIYSLRDQKGEPHVTLEMEGMYVLKQYGDKAWSEMSEQEQVELEHSMRGESDYGRYNAPSLYLHPNEEGDHYPYEKTYISPEDETEGYSKNTDDGVGPITDKTFKIVQIQGQGNKTPKPEYQAMIKEFLSALRDKGWKFERSENWYGNWDNDAYADGYDPEYDERIDDARSLDDWWDDHYQTQHGLYRTQEGREDAYGMALPNERMRPGVSDWTEVLVSIAGSLINDYDQGKFRANWATAAQQVYHAWVSDMSKDDPDEQYLAQETKNFESEIEGVEEKISEWENENEWYALNDGGMKTEIAQELQTRLEKAGEWEAMLQHLVEEHGELEDPEMDEWEPDDILQTVQEHDPDLYYEIIHEEINKWYSGDCYKFTQYLYMLIQKHGLVGPNDLPDPNERHGGLPSFDELQNMNWKSEVNRLPTEPEIPGTFSHWHEAVVEIGKCQCGGSIGADGYCMVCGRYNDEFGRQQRVPRGMPQPQTNPIDAWMPYQQTEEIAGTFSSWHEAMADRSGNPEIDKLIEDFLKEPYDEYGDTGETFRDPEQAHGNCQAVTEKFVEFAKARGFNAYSTDTDMEEMGYKPSVEPFGEIGFDENEEMQYGFYPEHTVASIYLEGQSWPIIIDFTATQYGYSDHPKVSHTASEEIQIHPLDQEHNVWFDEYGNQNERFRAGWVKNPETDKFEQTGPMEDTLLDKMGRQAEGYAAYHGDKPVASLTYVDDPAGWIMLGQAYTHPDYRQQGLFNRLAQPLRDSGKPIDAYVWNNPWLKNKVRDWLRESRMPKSSKLGFFKVAADINELAANAIQNLMAREDLVAMNASWLDPQGRPVMEIPQEPVGQGLPIGQWMEENGYTANPKYNGRLYGIIQQALGQMPPELYKFFPWLVKQFKNGLLDRVPNNHVRDILTQAWQHMEYLRSQPPNSPNAGQLPDINQLDWPALEAWVYQRNAMGIDVRPGYQWDYQEDSPSTNSEAFPNSELEENPVEYPHEPQRKKWDVGDGWQVWPVWTEQDLKQEGDMMGHCVGGYCGPVHSGSSAIFSLRDSKGEPHATIELEPVNENTNNGVGGYSVVQIQGKQNSEPSDEYKARVAQFFRDLQEAGHPVTWTINISSAYDLDDYQHLSPPSDYGIPVEADIDVNNVCREMMDDAETGSSDSYHLEGLDNLINEGLVSYQDVKYEMQANGESLIEDKARDLQAEWEDKKRELQKLYEEELSDHIEENHDLEDEDADSEDTYGFPEFEEWLENNYPDEYQQEYYGFTEAAEDELPEVVELMQRFGSVNWGEMKRSGQIYPVDAEYEDRSESVWQPGYLFLHSGNVYLGPEGTDHYNLDIPWDKEHELAGRPPITPVMKVNLYNEPEHHNAGITPEGVHLSEESIGELPEGLDEWPPSPTAEDIAPHLETLRQLHPDVYYHAIDLNQPGIQKL